MTSRAEAIQFFKKNPLSFYKKQCVVVSKGGVLMPFVPNETQLILHHEAEKQLSEKGKIRLIILKGRQQGCTTFIRMRFYHKLSHTIGHKALVMVHLHDAGKNLFSQIRQCYDAIDWRFKPPCSKNNESVLAFDAIQSQFTFATAGSRGTGRSATLQLFHGSEVAFWDNASEHTRGMMQALSSEAGSECFLESTANGMTGDAEEFYNKFMSGLDDSSDFKSIFIPWFTNSEYQSVLPNDFELKTYDSWCEKEYKNTYNLTDTQVYWARQKINTDFNKRYDMFCIEYPANPHEAFEGTGENSFIEPRIVIDARKREFKGVGDKILGVDVGGDEFGKDPDRSVIALKQGNSFKIVFEKKGISRDDLMQKISDLVREFNPTMINIDITGIGYNMDRDLIHLCNVRNIAISHVNGVNFGSNAVDSVQFTDCKAEMYYHLREALILGSCDDSAELQKDLLATGYERDKMRRLKMQSKKNLSKSPDLADSMALCCYQTGSYFSGVF